MRNTWGSLTQRTPGSWEIRYRVDGERRSETVRGTRTQAEGRLAELRVRYGHVDACAPMTLSVFWTHYYRPFIDDLADATISGYESAWRCHVQPAFGETMLDAITPIGVQAWLDSMSYGAAKKSFAVFRAMLAHAVDMDLIDRNVADKRYKMPTERVMNVNDGVLDQGALEEIFSRCAHTCWEGPFILSAFGGLRREEAFGVRCEDVTMRDGWCAVEVRRGVQHLRGEVRVTDLKTKESRRTAVVVDPYATRLAGICEGREGWICDDGFGGPADPDTVAAAYRRWFIDKPLACVPWKNLRKSYTTALHDAGVDLATVARLLGHTSPSTTYRHYDRPEPEQLAAAVLSTSVDRCG